MNEFTDDLMDEIEQLEPHGGCDEMSALLQPFIDDELEGHDRESMANHLVDCDACRGEVQSQHHVRAALRQLELNAVPDALRERIRVELDRVDLEDANGVVRIGDAAPSRARAFARGIGMMLPAAAAAVALFFVVRANPEQDAVEAANILSAASSTAVVAPSAAPPAPEASATPIARPSLPPGIELVGGQADPKTGAYHYTDRRSGLEFSAFAQAAGSSAIRGTRHMFRGQAYFLGHDAAGRPQVQVRRDGMLYTFVELTGPVSRTPAELAVDVRAPKFRRLVAFAQSLQQPVP